MLKNYSSVLNTNPCQRENKILLAYGVNFILEVETSLKKFLKNNYCDEAMERGL